jgi:hypothetical protein
MVYLACGIYRSSCHHKTTCRQTTVAGRRSTLVVSLAINGVFGMLTLLPELLSQVEPSRSSFMS